MTSRFIYQSLYVYFVVQIKFYSNTYELIRSLKSIRTHSLAVIFFGLGSKVIDRARQGVRERKKKVESADVESRFHGFEWIVETMSENYTTNRNRLNNVIGNVMSVTTDSFLFRRTEIESLTKRKK